MEKMEKKFGRIAGEQPASPKSEDVIRARDVNTVDRGINHVGSS